MSGWVLPVAAGGFWAGLLLWPVAGRGLSVWSWLIVGIATALGGVWAAPSRMPDHGSLERAGLAEPGPEDPLGPVSAGRLGPGRGPPGALAALVAVGVVALGIGWGGLNEIRVRGALLARIAPVRVEAVGSLHTDPAPTRFGWGAVLDVSWVRWGEGRACLHEAVWLEGEGDVPAAVRGDRLEVVGPMLPPDGGFGVSLLRRGIVAELRANQVTRLGPSTEPVVRAAQAFRGFMGRSIGRLFPDREAGLLLGLALGDASRLDPGVVRDFQATGLGHLLVVSGENVAMVLAPVLGLAVLLRLSRLPRFLLGIGTVVFFVVLTGAEPSVMRAGVMAALAMTGVLLGRPGSTASILSGAVLVLLALDPTLVWSIGFQLSVAATAGMVVLASPIGERLAFLPTPLALAAGTTLAAQLGVTPVLLFHFHEVPLVTALANVLAFPAVSPALLLGLLAAAVGLLSVGLGRVFAGLSLVPMRYLEGLADRLARSGLPWITSGGGPIVLLLGFGLVALAAWWFGSRRRIPRALVVAGTIVLPLVVWSSALSAGPPSGLVVRFFDVGQGDAALLTSPGGASILVDGGPDPELVATDLSALGVHRLDVVIATHPHADHIVGLPAVFARFPVGLVLEPGCPDDSPFQADLDRAIADEHLEVRTPRTGDTFQVADVHLEVLSPEECWTGTNSDANNDSLVVLASVREHTVLFGAEPEQPAQLVMLDDHEPLHAELLKVPHHGAATSLPAFFEAVDPEVAVVSVGPNTYGHPVPEVLDEIEATGAQLLRTDQEGTITVSFWAQGLEVASAA